MSTFDRIVEALSDLLWPLFALILVGLGFVPAGGSGVRRA